MKKFIIILSEHFPDDHIHKGQPTDFIASIHNGTKIHTIRKNYNWWAKRIAKVQAGEAYLSLRVWSGEPYNSKQIEKVKLFADHGVGIEKMTLGPSMGTFENGHYVLRPELAKNDGLSLINFNSWFPVKNEIESVAIIHFTKFRYNK
jgi:hypothetical protein